MWSCKEQGDLSGANSQVIPSTGCALRCSWRQRRGDRSLALSSDEKLMPDSKLDDLVWAGLPDEAPEELRTPDERQHNQLSVLPLAVAHFQRFRRRQGKLSEAKLRNIYTILQTNTVLVCCFFFFVPMNVIWLNGNYSAGNRWHISNLRLPEIRYRSKSLGTVYLLEG